MRGSDTNHSSDHTRDPCPYNIVSDVGIGFSIGVIGGTFWHGFKGYRNSPQGERWLGAISSIKARAPIAGGNFAVWSGLFNTFDCILADVRAKEDGWNPIMAGAATGAVLAVRSGPRGMALSATVGAVILAVMEGANVMISKMSSGSFDPQPLPPPPNMDALQKKALTSADSDTPGSSSDGSDGLTFSSTQPSAAHEPTSQPQQSSPPQPQQSTPQTGLFKGRFGIA